jgi:hypothetical protein
VIERVGDVDKDNDAPRQRFGRHRASRMCHDSHAPG